MNWKKCFYRAGSPILLLGCLLLGVGFPTGMNDHNWYLILCLVMVVAGLVLHVVSSKKRSKY